MKPPKWLLRLFGIDDHDPKPGFGPIAREAQKNPGKVVNMPVNEATGTFKGYTVEDDK